MTTSSSPNITKESLYSFVNAISSSDIIHNCIIVYDVETTKDMINDTFAVNFPNIRLLEFSTTNLTEFKNTIGEVVNNKNAWILVSIGDVNHIPTPIRNKLPVIYSLTNN